MSGHFQDTLEFRPGPRSLIIGLISLIVGISFGAFFVWLAFDLLSRGEKVGSLVLCTLAIVCSGLCGWVAVGCFRLSRMRVVISSDALTLVTIRFKAVSWNPWNVRKACLAWLDIKALRLWEVPNQAAPDELERRYVLYTSQGPFLFTNFHWPLLEEMATTIGKRANLEVAHSIEELPPDLVEATQPSRSDRRFLVWLRILGWIATVLGYGALPLALFLLLEREASKGLSLLVIALNLLYAGSASRNYRLG